MPHLLQEPPGRIQYLQHSLPVQLRDSKQLPCWEPHPALTLNSSKSRWRSPHQLLAGGSDVLKPSGIIKQRHPARQVMHWFAPSQCLKTGLEVIPLQAGQQIFFLLLSTHCRSAVLQGPGQKPQQIAGLRETSPVWETACSLLGGLLGSGGQASPLYCG